MEEIGAKSIDEAIDFLLKEYKRLVLEKSFSVDKGRIKPFQEEERLEDREL